MKDRVVWCRKQSLSLSYVALMHPLSFLPSLPPSLRCSRSSQTPPTLGSSQWADVGARSEKRHPPFLVIPKTPSPRSHPLFHFTNYDKANIMCFILAFHYIPLTTAMQHPFHVLSLFSPSYKDTWKKTKGGQSVAISKVPKNKPSTYISY